MSRPEVKRKVRCAVYTRKSSEEGLELAFNSLDAQREACAAYVDSQRHEGWLALDDRYDDGGYSGGTLERPGLQRLIRDIEAGRVDTVVCYKIDRLSRSLTDFAKLVDVFERNSVTFVSVTQSFCTTTSMGRLTLTSCSRSRSSSGNSRAKGSGTSSPRAAARASSWAATRRSATTSGTASWW
jgi:site-specific DNA recombinase